MKRTILPRGNMGPSEPEFTGHSGSIHDSGDHRQLKEFSLSITECCTEKIHPEENNLYLMREKIYHKKHNGFKIRIVAESLQHPATLNFWRYFSQKLGNNKEP